MDVTEMRRTYMALDHSEKLLRNLFSNIPVGVEIYNKDGILIDLNNKDMEIFGVKDKSSTIGVNFYENPNVPSDIRERVKVEDELDFSQDYEFSNVSDYYESEKRGGIELYTKISKIYDKQGDNNGFVLINIDNTERISSINRIRDFENFFLLISEYAKVGYAKLNLLTRNGYAIKQWYKNMGEDEDTPLVEVVGIYNKMHPQDRVRVLAFFEKAKRGEATSFKSEMRVLKSGTLNQWNWVRMNVVLNRYDPENGLIELIGVNYDITELKETEQKLIEAKEKAEEADRLKSAFLANMSHEIRTPLNAIVGFSSLLVETEDQGEKREYSKMVEENNELLLQLISDILDLSKIEAGTLEYIKRPMNLGEVCRTIYAVHKERVKEGVTLVFDNEDENLFIEGDQNRIMQVITNFLTNASKFTYAGEIRLGFERTDKNIRVYVKDTGIGIEPEKVDHIFERFVKLNSFAQGTGLGLSICQMIIEKIGGEIGVTSELGKGSTFYFTIPYEEAGELGEIFKMSKTESKGDTVNRVQQIKKILVAEDVESNFILLKNLIGREYTLLWAKDGVEAIEMYKQYQPDLILMDIKMPRMDGLEATHIIRSYSKDIPIIALTAYAFETDKELALEMGCNDFVTKPVSERTLRKALDKYSTIV